MKALALLLLALALGAGVLYFLLDSGGGGRGARPAPIPPRSQVVRPAGRTAVEPDRPAKPAAESEPPVAAARRAVETAPAAAARAIYEGTVIGEGAPIPGATVELLRRETPLSEARTDERGRFRLDAEPPGTGAVLRVRARGFVAVERRLPPKAQGGTELLGNLRVIRGQRVTGRVIDGRGNGVADADLRVEPINAGGDVLCARGRSTPDGSFEIPDAPPGMVVVSARAKGLGEQSVQHTPGPRGAPLEIQLQPGMELRLRLETPRGVPVAGAEVSIQAPGDPRGAPRIAESDEEGRVVFEGLGARLWNVRVTHPDHRPAGKSQVQATGAEERIECHPWPGIEGTVRAPGGAPPPAGTRVHALPASAPGDRIGQLGGGTEVASDGRFRVGGLRPGDWTIRVSAPGFAPAGSLPVKLGMEGDGYAGTIELSSGGKLVLQITSQGKPLVGAEVELLSTPPTAAQLWALQDSGGGPGQGTRSGPDGSATLENLSDGQVWVAVYADGFPPASSGPHRADSTGSAPPVSIEVQRGARVRGRVLGKDGAPIPGAQLRITERAGKLGFPLTLASDEAGRYTSAWLPSGRYAIEAFASSDPTRRSGTREFDLEAGEQHDLDLSL